MLWCKMQKRDICHVQYTKKKRELIYYNRHLPSPIGFQDDYIILLPISYTCTSPISFENDLRHPPSCLLHMYDEVLRPAPLWFCCWWCLLYPPSVLTLPVEEVPQRLN